MEHTPGESLQSCWSTLNEEAKTKIVDQLRAYFVELRNIPHQGYFGVVGKRSFEDGMFRPFDVTDINDTESNDTDQKPSSGSFESEKEMIEAFLSRYHLAYPKLQKCEFYRDTFQRLLEMAPQFSATRTFSGRMLSFGRTGLRY